jgi:hypothetical protein
VKIAYFPVIALAIYFTFGIIIGGKFWAFNAESEN